MNQTEQQTTRETKVAHAIVSYPELFPQTIQDAVIKGEITLGMNPYQAHLSGGAYAFRVIADPKHWKDDADPYRVIQAQTLHPDDSQIWMTFQNETQYPTEGLQAFQVTFQQGKVVDIQPLAKETKC
ncbi:hypothetical protein [Sulfurospirillum deleyianum]|uniref:Uncharacterized protein n=1 Tax=Sulfurospirillum deleyianum (strain ATCC 51133 / DSM 6946 / 5175) TaxID=525898 RepID=D1B2F1_SULD5|nr:hypothetical protein [Sulfurospirillum deleyianum]ACZ12271.1 conserved hypothetical protein [Sulfurospirillum deleyianum DSM 6946]